MDQRGGGAWSVGSSGNDYTYDLLGDIGIFHYEDDKVIMERDPKKIDKVFKKLYVNFDKEVRKQAKGKRVVNTDFSEYNLNYAHLGVIIYMLHHGYKVPPTYLKRALANAYKEYIKIVMLGPATGWKDPEERRVAIMDEILLLNYAINRGTYTTSSASLRTITPLE